MNANQLFDKAIKLLQGRAVISSVVLQQELKVNYTEAKRTMNRLQANFLVSTVWDENLGGFVILQKFIHLSPVEGRE